MEFTNKTLGYLLIIIVIGFLNYVFYLYAQPDCPRNGLMAVISGLAGIADLFSFIWLVLSLLDNKIKFKVIIPNPLKGIQNHWKQKRETAEAIKQVYIDMCNAESEQDLDFLLRKVEELKKL